MAFEDNISISSETIETVIGAQTKFKGSVNTDKPIRIDGIFEGEIVSTSTIIVSKCGFVKGEIKCVSMNLVGCGEGKLECSELLEITETGSFTGDVVTKDLISVMGSKIKGTTKVG